MSQIKKQKKKEKKQIEIERTKKPSIIIKQIINSRMR